MEGHLDKAPELVGRVRQRYFVATRTPGNIRVQ